MCNLSHGSCKPEQWDLHLWSGDSRCQNIIKTGKWAATSTYTWLTVCFLSFPQSISAIVMYCHPAEEWRQVRGGGWKARAECSRERPDRGEEPAGGAAQGDDSKSTERDTYSLVVLSKQREPLPLLWLHHSNFNRKMTIFCNTLVAEWFLHMQYNHNFACLTLASDLLACHDLISPPPFPVCLFT